MTNSRLSVRSVQALQLATEKEKNQGCYGFDIKDKPTVLEMLPLSKALLIIPLYLAEQTLLFTREELAPSKDVAPASQNSLQLRSWGHNKGTVIKLS